MFFCSYNNRIQKTKGKVWLFSCLKLLKKLKNLWNASEKLEVLQKTVIDFYSGWLMNGITKFLALINSDWEGTKIWRKQRGCSLKAYIGSYFIRNWFRTEFLKELWVVSVTFTVAMDIRAYSISTPRQISDTRWEVDCSFKNWKKELVYYGEKREVSFNRTCTCKSIVLIS